MMSTRGIKTAAICEICKRDGYSDAVPALMGFLAKVDAEFKLRWICEPCLCVKLGIA